MTGPGTPEQGRYRFEGRIATGGMGEVWRATDQVLGREVAVKVLKAEYADDPTFRSRFETEARNAAALHHPNVASVFDFGELPGEDGSPPRPYLVMELVRGEPLSALLRGGEPMPAETAANLLAQAADGLAAAHDLGIVHRDVKPANLLVTPDRTMKITDFGIARAADAVALTQTGQVIGTPQYLSPEQAEGKPATAASDIYSLGVVLYECLAGRRPFDGDSPIATALAHLREEPPALPDDVPARMRETVHTALAKEPAARFATVRDFAASLRGEALRDGPAAPAAVPDGDAPTRVDAAAPAVGAAAGAAGSWDDNRDGGTRAVAPPPGHARRRFPAWLPWVAAAVAVLVVVVVLAKLSNGRDDGTATGPGTGSASPTSSATKSRSTSPSNSPSKNPSKSPSKSPSASKTTDDRVEVDKGDYVGRPKDAARHDLEALGLKVAEHTVDNPGGKTKDTVADVGPTGRVDRGSTVTLSVYDDPTPVSTPTLTSPTPTVIPTPGPGPGQKKGADKSPGPHKKKGATQR